ncbi:MAG: hypothetical protein GY940_43395, partial [bacterium]|nr:hypothetical protein [bacterium]
WGFSGFSFSSFPAINTILEDVEPCDPSTWIFSRQISEYRNAKEMHHILDDNNCLYGLWGKENDLLERRFGILEPYMQLEIRARFWFVCALKRGTFGYIEINGKTVWKNQRKRLRNCKGLTLAPYSSEWMDNYQCLKENPKTACYFDVVIPYPYSEEDGEVLSIRFLTDAMRPRTIKGGNKGWGISHFSVRISKARGLWRNTFDRFWDGTTLNTNLEWFSAASLIDQFPTDEIDLINPGAQTSYVWTGFYESNWMLPVKFRITSDGNALLLVNNQIVINKMGEAGESTSETVESETWDLKGGTQIPVALYYSNKEEPGNIKLEWMYDAKEDFECVDWKSELSMRFFHNPSQEKMETNSRTVAPTWTPTSDEPYT